MTGKREQIVRAALQRYRAAGVCGTTLKDVAEASGVPLGNLYYYFKTREELVLAVLDECESELGDLLGRLGPLSPAQWFAQYFDWLLGHADLAAHFGCPFGTLAAELRVGCDPAAPRAAEIVERYLGALRKCARAAGLPDALADDVFMTVQGGYTVAHTLGDPGLFVATVKRVRERTLPLLGG